MQFRQMDLELIGALLGFNGPGLELIAFFNPTLAVNPLGVSVLNAAALESC
jgi:hypothetical protein